MAEAIASSLKKLKKIEERLSELEKKLEVDGA
jgi:tetrahydromethanopterin S-methyltransferase subunit G